VFSDILPTSSYAPVGTFSPSVGERVIYESFFKNRLDDVAYCMMHHPVALQIGLEAGDVGLFAFAHSGKLESAVEIGETGDLGEKNRAQISPTSPRAA